MLPQAAPTSDELGKLWMTPGQLWPILDRIMSNSSASGAHFARLGPNPVLLRPSFGRLQATSTEYGPDPTNILPTLTILVQT